MELKVLWTNKKNGNGILVDSNKNEYYIDSSIPCFNLIKRHDTVNCVTYTLFPDKILCIKDINWIDHYYNKGA